MNALGKAFSAMMAIGVKPLALYAIYQFRLKYGFLSLATSKWQLKPEVLPEVRSRLTKLITLPNRDAVLGCLDAEARSNLIAELAYIRNGHVNLFHTGEFGEKRWEMTLLKTTPLYPWCDYETGKLAMPMEDPKFTWEPGRFGWAFTLGRGYHLLDNDQCAETFWNYADLFLNRNPPFMGPHWMSAQEAALRLIAFCWALRVFIKSKHCTPERQLRLLGSIAAHAERIPPTLSYAISQNNNHLLTEAAGLYTAGILLTDVHPMADRWRRMGWKWFHRGLNEQIDIDGNYVQNSTNYHRLMLQISLWVELVARHAGDVFPQASRQLLAAATNWLANLLDPVSGRAPNLGPNDGAYIFPLVNRPFDDFRPVVGTSQRAFCRGQTRLPGDEMDWWFGLADIQQPGQGLTDPQREPVKLVSANSWAYLRAVHFRDRPGHADQLHLDLWWRGRNIAMDAGTYRYTAPVPWDNALTVASVHNTVTVDGLDQMKRVGRFLYLDWAQAEVTADETAGDGAWQKLTAEHDGYRQLGLSHRRSVTAFLSDRWLVEDDLLMGDRRGDTHTYRLHWLLPDWEWELEWKTDGVIFGLNSVEGKIQLAIRSKPLLVRFMVVRAGEVVQTVSSKMEPFPDIVPTPSLAILGWYSPTYAVKKPALSLVAEVLGETGANFISEWRLPQI